MSMACHGHVCYDSLLTQEIAVHNAYYFLSIAVTSKVNLAFGNRLFAPIGKLISILWAFELTLVQRNPYLMDVSSNHF